MISLDRRTLPQLLFDVNDGLIQLPEFQREFAWQPSQIIKFFDSVTKQHPSGSLLFLEVDQERPLFSYSKIRSLVHEPREKPRYLILDGQQRLTSLHLAFSNSDCKDSSYFVDLFKLMDEIVLRNKRLEDIDLIGDKILIKKRHVSNPQTLFHGSNLFPLSSIIDFSKNVETHQYYSMMIFTYVQQYINQPDYHRINEFMNVQFRTIVNRFLEYEFPVVILSRNLSVSAVCSVFQNINTTGLKLTAFDICVATLTQYGINLRSDLDVAKENNQSIKAILESDNTILLQLISLLSDKSPKKNRLPENIDKETYNFYLESSKRALSRAVKLLDDFGVGLSVTPDYLPYQPVVPVIAAVIHKSKYEELNHEKQIIIAAKLKKWFFTACLKSRYSEGTDNKMIEDVKNLLFWINDYNSEVPAIDYLKEEIIWNSEALKRLNKNAAIGKTILVLINSMGPRDFFTDDKVGFGQGTLNDCQLHHIFPKNSLVGRDNQDLINSVFNFTFLSLNSNQLIKDRATNIYLQSIRERRQQDDISSILSPHFIDNDSLAAMENSELETFLLSRIRNIGNHLVGMGLRLHFSQDENSKNIMIGDDIDGNY